MARFRRKVTEVEAVQFTGKNHDEVGLFGGNCVLAYGDGTLSVHTPSGVLPLEVGDYVAQNPKDAGDFYPIKAAQFADLYEAIEEPATA